MMEVPRERSRSPPTSLVVWRWCWKKTPDTHTWYWECGFQSLLRGFAPKIVLLLIHRVLPLEWLLRAYHRTERGSGAVRHEQSEQT